MKSKTQIGMVLAGWLLGTLGVAVLAYKIKPASGASTQGDEEFVIPADPEPATDKTEESPARPDVTPNADACLGMPELPRPASDDGVVLARAVSSGEQPAPASTEPLAGGTEPKTALPPPTPAFPPINELKASGTSDKSASPFPPAGASPLTPNLPVPPAPPALDPLGAPRADLLKPIPEPPVGARELTVAGFAPPSPTGSSEPPKPPSSDSVAPPLPPALTGASTFCKAPAESLTNPPAFQTYVVKTPGGETMREIARGALKNSDRWNEISDLNPYLSPEAKVPAGTTLRLPAATLAAAANVMLTPPAPTAPKQTPAAKAHTKALPLTGKYPCKLGNQQVALPAQVWEQLGEPTTLLAMPGPDGCVWLCTPASLERAAARLERKPNGAAQARAFRRLRFAQTERLAVDRDGKMVLPDSLSHGAGFAMGQEGVFIGVGDHIELWEAQRWHLYSGEHAAAAKPEGETEWRQTGVQSSAASKIF